MTSPSRCRPAPGRAGSSSSESSATSSSSSGDQDPMLSPTPAAVVALSLLSGRAAGNGKFHTASGSWKAYRAPQPPAGRRGDIGARLDYRTARIAWRPEPGRAAVAYGSAALTRCERLEPCRHPLTRDDRGPGGSQAPDASPPRQRPAAAPPPHRLLIASPSPSSPS